jgi:hypothetical protein
LALHIYTSAQDTEACLPTEKPCKDPCRQLEQPRMEEIGGRNHKKPCCRWELEAGDWVHPCDHYEAHSRISQPRPTFRHTCWSQATEGRRASTGNVGNGECAKLLGYVIWNRARVHQGTHNYDPWC